MTKTGANIQIVRSREELGPRIRYNIESVRRIDKTFLVNGWLVDPDQQVIALVLNKPAGKKTVVAQTRWVRFVRRDVRDAFPQLVSPNQAPEGFAFTANDFSDPGDVSMMSLTLVTRSGMAFVEHIPVREESLYKDAIAYGLGVTAGAPVSKQMCDLLYQPVVEAAMGLRKAPSVIVDTAIGAQPTKPGLSVIIPIYGGLDLIQYQMGNLAAVGAVDLEIIFAIDDPNLVNGALQLVERLHALLGLGVRVLAPDSNLGFAGINNFAAKHARADQLLFLNSDCFPVSAGWADRLRAALSVKPVGIVGARLVYADQTIQHDGMAFERKAEFPGFVVNAHPNKSMPAALVNSDPEKESSTCVTAAFMGLRRSVFEELEGFDEGYYRGDFEDSDLCLKAIERKLKVGIIRDQTIYHLERLSQGHGVDGGTAQKITLTNAARHASKWGDLLEDKLPLIASL